MHYYIFQDLNEILRKIANNVKPSVSQETVERLNSFLSKIYRIQIYKDAVFDFMEDEETKKMVYFSSDQLRNLLTNQYNEFINELHSHEIIKIEEKYFKYGKHFKLFLLTDKPLKSTKISSSIKSKRVKNGLKNYYKSNYNTLKGIDKKVFNILWKIKINITQEEIQKELHHRYSKYKKEKMEYINNLATTKEITKGMHIMTLEEYLDQSRFYYDYITLWNESTKIEKTSFVSIDSFGNRFHSIFTTLPSFFRNYLHLDGSTHIVGLDLAQSQPTLLAKMLLDEIGQNEFTMAVNSGDVYSYYPYERSNAKKQFLRSIFSNRYSKSFFELSRQFPSLGQYILKIQNTQMYRDGKKIPSYKNTSCILQRFESRLFRKIWSKLLNSEIQFINVHDGIYVSADKVEITKEIIEKILENELTGIRYYLK
ncbi:hypothetical protein [Saccharicrinis sp. FJH54]|uniref:hypothetical protein n=1 Tax=Saccharicrinis sp. FJH54 TaxID=3344665 RepID=UPI0035D4239D